MPTRFPLTDEGVEAETSAMHTSRTSDAAPASGGKRFPAAPGLFLAAHFAEILPASSGEGDVPDVPAVIHLIPAGEFSGRDGRGSYHLDASAVMTAFGNNRMPVAIDYEHQSIYAADNGQPAPAAGWIQSLVANDDGLWGVVEWTERAKRMIAAREYRYISPVFTYDTGMRVTALVGAGLTNQPNLYLAAIHRMASQSAANPPDAASHSLTESSQMNDLDNLLERLRYLFNLPTLAGIGEVIGELDKLKALLDAPEAAAMRQALELSDEAALPELFAAMSAAHGSAAHGDSARGKSQSAEPDGEASGKIDAADETIDLSKAVPRAEYDRLLEAHRKLTEEADEAKRAAEETRAHDAVEAAIHARKITPASRESMKAYCRKDPEGFARFVAAAIPVLGEPHRMDKPADPAPHPLLADALRRVSAAVSR